MAVFFPFHGDRNPPGSFQQPINLPVTAPGAGKQIMVCFSEDWLPAIIGSLFQLTMNTTWVVANQAELDAALSQANQLLYIFQSFKDCPTETAKQGEEIQEMSQFRIDCDCNVFVTCCDGTEKQILTADQVQALLQSQPGAGAKQPPPGGGQVCYHASMNGNQQWLIPTPVNSGDLIAIQNAVGAVSNSHNGFWTCPDGGEFFAGLNTGVQAFDGTNPVPSAPTSSLIINFGAGWQALGTGSVTVPGGVSNVQPLIQVNDTSISGDSGNLNFDVCVTNNATPTWCYEFDFTKSAWGWAADVNAGNPMAQWVAGVGWQQMYDPASQDTQAAILITFPFSFAPDTMSMTFDASVNNGGVNGLQFGSASANPATASGTNITQSFAPGVTANNAVALVYCNYTPPSGSHGTAVIKKITFTGHGTNPFGASNC